MYTKKKSVFITGANGFIGQHLVDYLSDRNYRIYVLLRKGSIPGFNLKENINIVYGDLLDKESLLKLTLKKSFVINLAANPYHPVLSYKVNVEGTRNLVNACIENKVEKIIHISSQATKIKNKGVYARTKLKSDEIIKKSGIKYIILKPSLVYGEGEKGLFNKIKNLITKVPFLPVFGNGETKVFPIYVLDLCKAIESAFINDNDFNTTYDIGSLKPVTYNNLYLKIAKKINKSVYIIHIPVFMGIFFGKIFQLLKLKNPPFFVDNVLGSTQKTNCDSKIFFEKYNFKPISFDKGLNIVFNQDRPVKVGVIGLGKMGLLHLSILNTFKDINIVALIDNNEKVFKTINSMGISSNGYTTLDEALEKEEINTLYILSPTFTHFELISKAIKNNLNIFIEKPVTLNNKEIKSLSVLSKDYMGVINVGYTLLFKRIFQRAKEIIDNKKFGGIKSFSIKYEHGEVFGPKKGWMFNKKRAGGGVLMNPGPHLYSIINLLFGIPNNIKGEIKRIYSIEVEDEAKMEFDYFNYKGEVLLSWSVKNMPIAQIFLEVLFDSGVKLNTNGKQIEIIEKGNIKEIINEKDIKSAVSPIFNINPEVNGEAYYVEDRLFVDSIKDRSLNNVNSLNFALDTEAIIYKSYNSCLGK